MANEFAEQAQHSAEYFGESRDYWWNDDFLALALRRWSVAPIRQVLDVGCGIGHWSRAWARVMPPEVQFTGVDREPLWVEKARERSVRAGIGPRCNYQVGLAEKLPFPDHSFDFVTCQTLLIHVPDVRAVLAEMTRVTRPGGIVVAAEPNNAANYEFSDGLMVGFSLDDILRLLRFSLTIFRGKAALGLGDLTIGRILPGEFQAVGLEDISVCLNEKAGRMLPPYTTPREHAYLEEMKDWVKRGFCGWSRADAEQYFIAGGGDTKDLPALVALELELRRRIVQAAEAHTYVCAGGSLVYLVGGRKAAEK